MSLHRYATADAQREVAQAATGIDYGAFEYASIGFDYEGLMASPNRTIEDVIQLQQEWKVGGTSLFELRNITQLVRLIAPHGKGARILLKDEAANASGSFKARRAVLAVDQAATLGYPGVVAATSGNFGAAVASQAAMRGLRCIILQETFDSQFRGQPEILEKGRACEAYGAEVLQVSVGPELFLLLLAVLDETKFYSASLYLPGSVLGIETLGVEIAEAARSQYGRDPDVVLISHAGGGNVTGTARGLARLGCRAEIVGVSVNLSGLHMASDHDFNRKSFTTSHTGFSIPFLAQPDRVELPRNAARPLRYLDRLLTVEQGEVFYATELLAQVEGLERGPAGNTALAAAIPLAAQMGQDQIVVVQESEYTGAGKSHHAQLTFARAMGIEVSRGDPRSNRPGQRIVIPDVPEQMAFQEVDLDAFRRRQLRSASALAPLGDDDQQFLAGEVNLSVDEVREILEGAR